MTTNAPRNLKALAILLIAASLAPAPANAALERVGPNDPLNFLPTWYQDTTGITLDFCTPRNQAELDGGWCLILPADVPTGLAPEVFPGNFSGEHFYWASDVVGDWTYTPPPGAPVPAFTTGRVVFVQAIEAAFLGDIGPGLGGVFGRVRIRVLDVPLTGTYKFYTPWGVKLIPGVAGGRIFDTEDIGINCAPFQYDCALQTSIGPFLLPSDTPGGAELAPVAGPTPGTFFISDAGRVGPVTGSPIPVDYTFANGTTANPNVFAIEAPDGTLIFQSHDFTTMGRLYTQVIPSRLAVDRTSYARDASAIAVDVYATGEPTLQPRMPASPRAPVVQPELVFYPEPCGGEVNQIGELLPPYSAPAGQTAQPMSRSGNKYWGQTGLGTLTDLCVADTNARNALGQVVPTYVPAPLADQVFVTEALFDPSNGGSLSVLAASSDQLSPPPLALGAFGDLAGSVAFVDGLAFVAPLAAPPSKVRVLSAEKGTAELLVVVGSRVASGVTLTADMPSPQTPGIAVVFTAQGQGATHYEYRFLMDSGAGFQVVRDWSPTPTWIMNGATPEGHYLVKAEVWAGLTPSGPDAESAVVPFDRRLPPATGVTITADRQSPAARYLDSVDTQFSVEGFGSTGGYQYRFALSAEGRPFVVVQDYGIGSTWALSSFTPIGTYSVRVDVRTSPTVDFDASATAIFQLVDPAPTAAVILGSSPASPHTNSATALFTAVASGSSGYEYQFRVFNSSGVVTTVQPYGPSATWTMPIGFAPGAYVVQVWVRTTRTVALDLDAKLSFTVVAPAAPPATGVTLSASAPSPHQNNTSVLFTATGAGSSGYQYQFRLYNSSGVATVVQPYGAANTWTMPAGQAVGTYVVQVWVRTSTLVPLDKDAKLSYTVVSPPPLPPAPATGVTLTPSAASPQPTTAAVTFTAAGQGSSGYQYQFRLFSSSGTATTVQAYSPLSSWTMAAGQAPGSYVVQVWVRTSSSVSLDAFSQLSYVVSP